VVEHLPTKQTPVPPKKQKNKKTPKKPQEEWKNYQPINCITFSLLSTFPCPNFRSLVDI
jgi:hypothetical protein